MGLPIRMVCAVTRNDIVARAIKDGDYSMVSEVFPTLAPAMDIQVRRLLDKPYAFIFLHTSKISLQQNTFHTLRR